ncbi:MAG: YHS domain-containing protein [Candidatus Entotheonellia bacterium]
MAKDPVCGMQVDEQTAIATSAYQGQTYYFCAKACKTAFDREPAQYLGRRGEAHDGRGVLYGEPSRVEGMSSRWRGILVGVVALVGIVLLILGIGWLRELMAIGTVPLEMLGRRVSSTVVSLFLSLTMIVWCLVAGLAWARLKGRT